VSVAAAAGRALAGADAGAGDSDWPMLGHDPGRSGATAAEVRPPFARKWARAFPDEGIMAGVQPVVSRGRVFVGTLHGVVHSIDAETGQDRWSFRAGGPVLHACAADAERVFFACADGKVYCLGADDGAVQWTVRTGAALWNAPALAGTDLFVGGRDGKLYAINSATGQVAWEAPVGAPFLGSPAVDKKRGRVYAGAEDMHVYAFERDTGHPLWTSPKLSGVSFRGYHPVVAPDGSVIITTQPGVGGDAIQQVMLDMVKEVFGDFASWRHKKEENARLREQNFRLMEDPKTYDKQLDYLRKRLTDEPADQTFFVLDPATGKQKFVTPVVYAESMNGTGSPPVVTPDGKVIVKYSALLRSRYEHYSPFLNVGSLDTATGRIAPVMDQARTYGWHDSLLLVHDEQSQLSVGGRVLFNAHQDNVNAMDLDTLKGYPFPLACNVHEAPPGAAIGIWADYLSGKPLPLGWEWFARGTAVYGGGSAIDVPVAIAGDSFYYLPTHEINAGCVLLAYRMDPGGKASERAPQPKAALTDGQWSAVQKTMRWDWDTLASPRLDVTLKALPAAVEGTRQRPLAERAKALVDRIDDRELSEKILVAGPVFARGAGESPERTKLEQAVEELIGQTWRPLLFPAGKAPAEAHRFFVDPAETLYTLALAYPHLSPGLREKVRAHVAALRAGPLAPGATQRRYDSRAGAVRSAYDPPPEHLVLVTDDVCDDTALLYPLWLWAAVADDAESLRAEWPRWRERVRAEAGRGENDCGNARVAGLVAAWRIAHDASDADSLPRLHAAALGAIRERLTYELAHTEGGVITMRGSRAVFGRWRHLTPEVARLCRTYAPEIEQHLMEVYVDYHRPTWWLAWNVETLWGNEVPTALPTHAQEVFAARAMVLGEGASDLAKFLDQPWCRADEIYIQKLALVLHAAAGTKW
jgi:outer membrane protein assembly factor BamB